MSNVLVESQSMKGIADAIRSKTGGSEEYLPSEMAAAIDNIQTFKPEETFTATPKITSQTITPTEGSVFSSGTVNSIYKEIATEAVMDANLVATNLGKMYKYTGENNTKYLHNHYYFLVDWDSPEPIPGTRGLELAQFYNIEQSGTTLEVE